MKIVFDHQIFAGQKHGGISQVFCNLISSLNSIKEVETILPISSHINAYLEKEKDFNLYKPQRKSFNFFKKFDNIDVIKEFCSKEKYDIFHSTYYNDYFYDIIKDKPSVTTIHDMTYEKYPEFYSLKDATFLNKKKIINNSNKVVVVSECTKKDLLDLTDIAEDKVEVVYPGLTLDQSLIDNTQLDQESKKNDYLLYVGNRTIYKNFYFVLSAIADFLKDNNLKLVCFGAELNKKEKIFINNLALENNVIIANGGDEELIKAFKGALAFLAPSYCEGFYLTLLEAFACSCPVIASNYGPVPEVADNAATYFNPKSKKELISAIEKVIGDKKYSQDMIKKGLIRKSHFSWEKAAKQMVQIYNSII